MKFKFRSSYFTVFVVLLAIEVLITLFFKSGFIRHTFGDYLVVILLFCFFRSFLKAGFIPIAITTLGIAYIIEFLQCTDFLLYIGLQDNHWANLIFGNYFSTQDLVAYTLGILTVTGIEISKQKIYGNK